MSAPQIEEQDALRLQRCLAEGGVAVFPTDTVYGICCDAEDEQAARRLYALRGARPRARRRSCSSRSSPRSRR